MHLLTRSCALCCARLLAAPLHIMAGWRYVGDEFAGGDKYESAAAASNGRVYAPPAHGTRVVEIDPAAGTTRLIGDELQARSAPPSPKSSRR